MRFFVFFFYHDGIYHALKWASPPDDEISIFKNWSELAQKYDLDLVVCISAAQRRGLINENVADGFRLEAWGNCSKRQFWQIVFSFWVK